MGGRDEDELGQYYTLSVPSSLMSSIFSFSLLRGNVLPLLLHLRWLLAVYQKLWVAMSLCFAILWYLHYGGCMLGCWYIITACMEQEGQSEQN